MKPPRWNASEWAAMNLLLEARAGGACERCGKECGPVERHHRKRKREGGDSLANLLMLGRECHRETHSHPVESRRFGWIVSMSKDDPATVPVLWRSKEWVYLSPDGTRHPLGEELADAHEHEGTPAMDEQS